MSVGVIAGNAASINLIQATIDLPEIAANTSEENDVTVTGLKVGDFVSAVNQTFEAGIVIVPTRVAADDTLPVRAINSTGSAVDASSDTYTLLVVRAEGNASTLPTGIAI